MESCTRRNSPNWAVPLLRVDGRLLSCAVAPTAAARVGHNLNEGWRRGTYVHAVRMLYSLCALPGFSLQRTVHRVRCTTYDTVVMRTEYSYVLQTVCEALSGSLY